MRERNPLMIVKEYLQPNESAQIRKNALTALAVLNIPESWAAITQVALNEPQPEVRERAELEVVAVPPELASQTMEPVIQDLASPQRQRYAYALLGRLRNRGMSFAFPHLPLATRLRLAKSMRDQLYPRRGIRFHFRTLKGVIGGTLLAWLAVIIYTAVLLDYHLEPWTTVGYLTAGFLIALAISMVATVFTSPTRLQADPGGGALLDMAIAGVVSLVAETAFVILVRTLIRNERIRFTEVLLLFFVPAAAATVRAGTLSAFGILRTPKLNFILQVAVGGSCGLVFYTIASMVAGKLDDSLFAATGIVLSLTSFGLAGAFAMIDSKSALYPAAPKYAQRLGLGIIAITLIIGLLPLLPSPLQDALLIGGQPLDKPYEIRHVPSVINLTSSTSFLLSTTITNPAGSYETHLTKAGSNEQIAYANKDGYEIKPGTYFLSTERGEGHASVFSALPEVASLMSWPQIWATLRRQPPDRGPILLKLTVQIAPSK